VNYWYGVLPDGSRLTGNEITRIAEHMRHSVTTAVMHYRKVNTNEATPLPDIEIKQPAEPELLPEAILAVPTTFGEIRMPPPPPPVRTPPPPPPAKFNPTSYATKYRIAHAEELHAKRKAEYEANKPAKLAAKIVWYLNHGTVTRPRAESIARYGLVKDEATGKWSANLPAATP
jgi:hypothetical protein